MAGIITALEPSGTPPKVHEKSPAPRPSSLDGLTVYLVDCRFDDSAKLLKQIGVWFSENMPTVTVKQVALSGTYATNDPALWEKIKADGAGAILGVGHCSTCAPAVSTHAITLETNYNVPTVAIHTEKFSRVVSSVTKMAGLPEAPLAFVPQPVMGKTDAELYAYVNGMDPIRGVPVMDEVIRALTTAPEPVAAKATARQPIIKRRLVTAASADELQEMFLERNWTDKLPVVLPTEERVEEMLAATSRRPDEVVGQLEPTKNRGPWSFTVENVAVNAVMAGAKPAYFPVGLALAASGQTARGSTSSSGSAMVVVNGPIRDEIAMNSGTGAMGPYNHANATIGRAYGLLSQNLQGGSVPGETFMGSQGNGHTYNNLTFAENEERSPWDALHVGLGFKASDSVATVFYGGRSTTFCLGLREDYWREHVKTMLLGTDTVTAPVLLLDPIAAQQFVERGGFDTRDALIDWLYETAKMPAGQYWDYQLIQNYVYPRASGGEEPMASRLVDDPHQEVNIFSRNDIQVVVVGGETNGYWQIIGARRSASVLIDDWR